MRYASSTDSTFLSVEAFIITKATGLNLCRSSRCSGRQRRRHPRHREVRNVRRRNVHRERHQRRRRGRDLLQRDRHQAHGGAQVYFPSQVTKLNLLSTENMRI